MAVKDRPQAWVRSIAAAFGAQIAVEALDEHGSYAYCALSGNGVRILAVGDAPEGCDLSIKARRQTLVIQAQEVDEAVGLPGRTRRPCCTK